MRALDVALPEFDWNEVHHADLPGTPERALAAVLSLPVAPDPIVGTLFRLRGLGRGPTIGEAFPRIGFETLARSETEIVVGGTGMPWRPGGGIRPFAEAPRGTVRVAFDFRAEPVPGGCRLSTETRIAAVDEAARRSFRRYWLVVGPFSALVRSRWLAAARRAVQASA